MKPKIIIPLLLAMMIMFWRLSPSPTYGEATGEVSVQNAGAKGDGATDDWDAIQKAIDSVAKAGGGTISFEPGTYKISKPLVLSNAKSVNLQGKGGATIKQVTPATTALYISDGSQNITVKGLTIIGPHGAADANHEPGSIAGGIIVGGLRRNDIPDSNKNIMLSDLHVEGFKHACVDINGGVLGAVSQRKNEYVTLQNSSVARCQNGVFIYQNSEHITITNNTIEDSWYDGIAVDTSAKTDPNAAVLPNTDLILTGNKIRRSGIYSGYPALESSSIGILLKGVNRRVQVSGNTIEDTGLSDKKRVSNSYGILLRFDANNLGGESIEITRNTISRVALAPGSGPNVTAEGIHVGNMTQVTIEDNTISGTHGCPTKVESSKDVALMRNAITPSDARSPNDRCNDSKS